MKVYAGRDGIQANILHLWSHTSQIHFPLFSLSISESGHWAHFGRKKKEQLCWWCNVSTDFVVCSLIVFQLSKAAFCHRSFKVEFAFLEVSLLFFISCRQQMLACAFLLVVYRVSLFWRKKPTYTLRTAAIFPAFHLQDLWLYIVVTIYVWGERKRKRLLPWRSSSLNEDVISDRLLFGDVHSVSFVT